MSATLSRALTRVKAMIPAWMVGPLMLVLATAALYVTSNSSFSAYVPFPVSILNVIVLYSVFHSGVRSGLLTAAMTLAYLAYSLSSDHSFATNAWYSWSRLLSWTVALPIMVAIVGMLKRRSLQAATSSERHRSLTQITQAMPQIVWTTNEFGVCDYFNQHWFEYCGLPQLGAGEQSWLSSVHPDDLANCTALWEKSLAQGDAFEAEHRLKAADGSYRWFLSRAHQTMADAEHQARWVGTCTDIDVQKAAEARTLAYRQRLEMILENVDAVIWAVDLNGVFIFSDGTALRSVGLRSGERIGQCIYDLYPPEHAVSIGVKRALLGAASQATFPRQNVTFSVTFSPTRGADGQVNGVVGISVDATTRLRTEAAQARLVALEETAHLVMESEAKFKGAFENSPIGIGLARPDGLWFDVNPAFCTMLGYTKAELLTKTVGEITPVEGQEASAAFVADLLSLKVGHLSFERRYLHKQGHAVSFWINGSLMRNAHGETQGILFQMVDVTERQRAERALAETTRQLRMLINSSPVGILTIDQERNVRVWNPALERMFGWKIDEIIGKPLPFVPTDERARSDQIIANFRDQEATQFEVDRVKKDGTKIRVEVAAIPLIDEQHQLTGSMAVITDITERAKAQRRMMEANLALQAATLAKSEFLANMSHEIRTPINGVLGMTGLLLDMELGREQRDYAETIRGSAEILLTLVNDVLDFSKIEAGKLDFEAIDFDLEVVTRNIERILSVAAGEKGLRLAVTSSLAAQATTFRGDPTRVGQILTNLLSNAVKFTAQGEISVNLSLTQETVAADGSTWAHLRIEVTDSGVGIAEAAMGRMFQPFSQADSSTNRRFGGTGLGLSICKRLVEAMGGQIGVTSREQQGSTFWFTLLLRRSAPSVSPVAAASEVTLVTAAKPTLHLLLAEDNRINQVIAAKTLQKYGFSVDIVDNGLKAVEAVKTGLYDLVLMDCQMPELDGFEATRRIRAMDAVFAKIPIIAMTANAMAGDRELCLGAGMDDYVTKPVKPQDLAAAIWRTVGRKVA